MPVELTIVETTLELGQTNVEVILDSSSAPGVAGPGVPTGGTDGQVLTKTSGTDYATAWEDPTGGGGGVTDADYLVGTAHGSLSAEIVVGTSPGGELGGTWASPTVNASHSGSTHAAVQAAAEATAASALSAHLTDTSDAHDASAISSVAAGNLAATDVQAALNELDSEKAATSHAHAGEDITSGTVADARIASTIARDSEVTSAISAHETDTTSVHGIADTSALALTANHPSNATFNDHSARHENGGADEISIAGLDGTPTELTNHLNDSSDAHDASAISVADSGTFYTATDVEGVLAEIAPQLGGSGSGARVRRTTNQAIPNATQTAISFDAERFDTSAFHDNSTNPTRLTIPASGTYLVGASVAFALGSSSFRQMGIRLNGTTFIGISTAEDLALFRANVTTYYDFTASDYIEVVVFQTSGGDLDIEVVGNYSPEFWITAQ